MDNITIGMDLGDKKHVVCILDNAGNVIYNSTIDSDEKSLLKFFKKYPKAKVAIEAGTHSPWISRLLTSIDCNVLVGNPRKLRAIWESDNKTDIRDAEMLARIARFDPHLLYPIQHKGVNIQADMSLLHSREALVKSRSSLIYHIRGSVKSFGGRLPNCSTESFHQKVVSHIPKELQNTIKQLIGIIEQLTLQIKEFDKQIEQISKERYPETELLRPIKGVGPLTSLAFILIIGDPERFEKSRQVGKFIGLTPKNDQSGENDKQLRITKAGSPFLRKLLVNAAQYILGPFGEECNLRKFGLRLARGGKTTLLNLDSTTSRSRDCVNFSGPS